MYKKWLLDKTGWLAGIWQEEPDLFYYIHESINYPCLASRNTIGTWCGFVGIAETHPLFMQHYETEPYRYIEVHGEVSFTGFLKEESLLFAPPKRWWWIGFDTHHEGDFCPNVERFPNKPRTRKLKAKTSDSPIYRDVLFVEAQLNILAMQLGLFDARLHHGS
jgi:hypothetical protein